MINLDSITKKKKKKHDEKLPFLPDHPNRIIIIGGSGVLDQEKQTHCLI